MARMSAAQPDNGAVCRLSGEYAAPSGGSEVRSFRRAAGGLGSSGG